MITPRAFSNIIKHFDEVDRIVSNKTTRKRPWPEVALTSLLCDLLDEESQEEEKLNYNINKLQEDLNKEDNLFGINLSLETIEFNSTFERYISQSDIGLKLVFEDNIEPSNSWTKPYLLQAKRLFPKKLNPVYYNETSTFASIDKDQQKRIVLLNKILGASFVKYLFFCPRPDNTDNDTKTKLSYLRTRSLSKNIFDYTLGFQIYNELNSDNKTLGAGIFITDTDNTSLNFGDVHSQILERTFPLSWFIVLNFIDAHYNFLSPRNIPKATSEKVADQLLKSQKVVEGILSGDKGKINDLIDKIKEIDDVDLPENIQIIPKHVITIRYSVGEQINPDLRKLRQ